MHPIGIFVRTEEFSMNLFRRDAFFFPGFIEENSDECRMNLFRRGLASWEHVIIAQGRVSYYSFLLVLNVDVRLFEGITVDI